MQTLISAYGLSTPLFHRGFSSVVAIEIQDALASLGPATNQIALTRRLINQAINWGHTPKFNAVMTLSRHALIDLNDPTGSGGRSLLHEIASNGESNQRGRQFPEDEYTSLTDRITQMVRQGAHPNQISAHGERPLSIAWTRTQDPDAVEIGRALLAAGADPMHFDEDGVTMLHFAAATGNTPMISTWQRAGYPVTILTREGNGTPAMFAALTNRHEALDRLLAQDNSQIDVFSETAGGTVLQIAVEHGSVECVAVLLARGANILVGLGTDDTPYKKAFRYAIATGDGRMLQMLQLHAADQGIPEPLLHH